MHRGYVKIWRKLEDSGILQNAELWQFMSYCLLKATHQPLKQMVGHVIVELKPGQFIFGRKKAATDLKTTERKIRTCLQTLGKLEIVTSKATSKFTIITINKWELYQGKEKSDQQNDQQVTNNRPASDQQVTNNRPASDHKQAHKNISTEAQKNISTERNNISDKPAAVGTDLSKYPVPVVEFVTEYQDYVEKEFNFKSTSSIINKGCDTVDKLCRIDGHELEFVRSAITWASKDDFWSAQIKSLAGLRKKGKNGMPKFENVLTAMQRGSKPKLTKDQQVSEANIANYNRLKEDKSWFLPTETGS